MRSSLDASSQSSLDVAELDSHLQKVERNVERMNVIIRHFVEFARGSQPAKGPTKLHEVVEKSFILISEQLRLKNIRVETRLCPEVMAQVDPARIEQVLINLLSNARDAISEAHGEAGGTILVCLRGLSESELEIEVSDNGIGVPEEIKSKIFNPFFTTKEVGKGTGLGLSISHSIVQDHGGTIACVSEPGRGASFYIRLPRYE
jgi:two-component system NtrC family sensor kinase